MAVIKSQEKKRFPHEQEFPRNIKKEVHGKNKAKRPKETRWSWQVQLPINAWCYVGDMLRPCVM